MEKVDLLIIGGSAGGIVTGQTARRQYKDASIAVIRKEKEGQVLVPCGLPYIFGTVGSPEKNIMPDKLLSGSNIDLIIDEVTSIDKQAKTVATASGKSIGYDRLVLATGADPIIIPIPGRDLENVFCAIKDVDYLNGLLRAVAAIKDVVIIGGGFIGLEFGDEFRKRGLNVTIVEMLRHCLELVFDEGFCTLAESQLTERGVSIKTGAKVEAILGEKKVTGVRLAGGEELKADLVFMCIGVRPNTQLAQDAGLEIGETKAVWVDEYGRTSNRDIFAVGDCAEKRSFFTKRPSALKLASIAAQEGRVVGANLLELRRRNEGVVGAFATIIGDSGVGMAGLTETQAKAAGFDVVTSEVKTPDKHPGSMPGAKEFGVKLVFEKATHELLGGQVCGGSTVGEVANVLAALIQSRMTASEVATFQYGTHPFFTPSPLVYPIVNAAELALAKL
ncbi:MAG: FAD-dependent oxidoreductase [Dehalococcoidia bacterium]|nr:FAD-dependent oxidoreductase [Dehalococcoidia bacterium]